jgi:hypothetical protein
VTGEVPGYVASAAKFRGWVILPPALSFAQETLDNITGMAGKLGEEHDALLETARKLYSSMTKEDAEEALKSAEASELAALNPGASFVRNIIGALLFDPTLPFACKDEHS